jgi:hypothetical protein
MATTKPAPIAAQATAGIGFSIRRNGIVEPWPVGPAAATGSGSWIVTACTAGVGIVIGFLHLGQGPVLPANLSLTEKREPQPAQRTWMGMAGSFRAVARGVKSPTVR